MITGSENNSALISKKYSRHSQFSATWKRFRKNIGAMIGLVVIIIIILTALTAPIFLDYETDVIGIDISRRLRLPSLEHPFGTDDLGRDIFSRVIYGARFSLAVGFVAVFIGLIVGVIFGALAGYFVGRAEDIIMRVNDVLSSIPTILLGIVIVSALGANTFNLMLAVGISSVPQFVRITRAAVLTVSSQEYVESCYAIGMSQSKIIALHVLPNCLSPIIVQTTLRIAGAIIAASSLSFLGLGVPAPAPEWGAMLSIGRQFVRTYPHITLFPGLAIMVTVLAFNMLGDGLRDALDPKLKK